MATDDERREVAERMRISAERYDFCAHNIALDMGIDADYDDVYDESHRQAWLSLADLIDPDTTTDTTKSPDVTTKCDREALLALADECDSVHMHKVARRIREACGEVAQ